MTESRTERLAAALRTRLGCKRPEYITNPGGFVNASFRVDDRVIKLVPFRESRGVRRWVGLADYLAAHHSAIPILDTFELADVEHFAVAFPWKPNISPKPALAPLLAALHRDANLASHLRQHGSESHDSCAAFFLATWIEMMQEDLRETREHPECPPFISAELWDWMADEVAKLAELAVTSAAFRASADAPVHGDFHAANVLFDGSRCWVIDWDELGLGDPVIDLVEEAWPAAPSSQNPRVELWMRAKLLTEVVDTLADWSEASAAPAIADEFRNRCRQVHESALEQYRRTY